MTTKQISLVLLGLLASVGAHYHEGVPRSFAEDDEVKLKVNKLTSTKTLLPIDYYTLPFCSPEGGPSMDNENLGEFLAGDRIESSPYKLKMRKEMYCEQLCIANLGRAEQKGITPNKVAKAIRKNYHNNWIVDNLPAASKVEDDYLITTRYWQGFPIGFQGDEGKGKAYIHNHVNIEITYHAVETEMDKYRVVRFIVEPFSIKHEFEPEEGNDMGEDYYLPKKAKIKNPILSCQKGSKEHTTYDMVTEKGREPQPASGQTLFTYDVTWIEDENLHWASRWDIYLNMDNAVPARVHWLSIANSLVVVVSLAGVLVAFWIRKIASYNKAVKDGEGESSEDSGVGGYLLSDETGGVSHSPHIEPELLAIWASAAFLIVAFVLSSYIFLFLAAMLMVVWLRKSLSFCKKTRNGEGGRDDSRVKGLKAVEADVFRPPGFAPELLAVCCGTGAQLLCTALLVVMFSVPGFMGPPRRGHFLMASILLFAFTGAVNGFVTVLFNKMFKGEDWHRIWKMAALGFPGLTFLMFITMNIVALSQGSTLAVPSLTLITLSIIWIGISMPLVYAGAFCASKIGEPIEFPVQPGSVLRPIPVLPRKWKIIMRVTPLLAGLLTFGSIFVEQYYIMASVWLGLYYYIFGFLFLVLLIAITTSALTAVLLTLLQLSNENWKWWWRSFCNAGVPAVLLFLYSILYYRQLEAESLATFVLYFGYMALVSMGVFLMFGFVGISASLLFNKAMYEVIGDKSLAQEGTQPLLVGSVEMADHEEEEEGADSLLVI